MKKSNFCDCLTKMREYSAWEKKLCECGFDLAYTPVTDILDTLARCMCDFNREWTYDTKLGIDWIIEWCFGPLEYPYQYRHGKLFDIRTAGALYDFIVYMNEYGWED